MQTVFQLDSNLRSADAELQQRASEYLALSKIASLDVLATVLEEMPPFPEKEVGGLLNLLKKKRPGRVPDNAELKSGGGEDGGAATNNKISSVTLDHNVSGGSADLLGLGFGDSVTPASAPAATNGVNGFDGPTNNIGK